MTESKKKIAYGTGATIFLLGVALGAVLIVSFIVLTPVTFEVSKRESKTPAVTPGVLTPARPVSPELDYSAECVWLTNHVLGPVVQKANRKGRATYLAKCAEDNSERYCKAKADELYGKTAQEDRSSFFYKCLDEIPHAIEEACCYDAWECRQELHYAENELHDSQEQCNKFCDRIPGISSETCYFSCN